MHRLMTYKSIRLRSRVITWISRWFIVAILSMAKEPSAPMITAWQSAREIVTATITAQMVWSVGIVTVMFRFLLDVMAPLIQTLPITVMIPQRKSGMMKG